MNRTVTIELTDELVVQSFRCQLGFGNFMRLAVTCAFVGGVAVAGSFRLGGKAEAVAVPVVAIMGLLICVYYWYGYIRGRNATLSLVAKLPHRRQSYTFSDDNFLAEGPLGQSNLSWEMLDKLEKFKVLWLLRFTPGIYALPIAAIDQDLAEFIDGKARERGVPIFYNGFSVRGE